MLIFAINCNSLVISLPRFQHRMKGHGGLVLVSARVCWVLFLLLTSLDIDSTAKWTFHVLYLCWL